MDDLRRMKRFTVFLASVIIVSVYVVMNRRQLPSDDVFEHFKRSTNLQYYLDNIELVVEPSSVPCSDNMPTPLLVMVASAPAHLAARAAIRQTWAGRLHTFFLLGLDGVTDNNVTIFSANAGDVFIEALQYNDIVGYKFRDSYQNLTLKSALMMHWVLRRCPGLRVLVKTDDDVIINPWTLDAVLKDHTSAPLIGYMFNNTRLHREAGHKWYIPRWMNVTDFIPHYLAGAGYIMKGEHIAPIFEAAKRVPLINIEDIYITYLVSNLTLSLNLVHDDRLSPYKPWFSSINCIFLKPAILHYDNNKIEQRVYLWNKIENSHREVENMCDFYNKFKDAICLALLLLIFLALSCGVFKVIVRVCRKNMW